MTEPQELKSLDQLATENDQIAPHVDGGHKYLWQHRVADQIHGWSAHEYHYQADPVMLTTAAYLSALESAKGDNAPHEPAIAVPPTREELDARIKKTLEANAAKKDELKQEAEAVKKGELRPAPNFAQSKGDAQ